MSIQIVKDKIPKNSLQEIAENQCRRVIIAVVDKTVDKFFGLCYTKHTNAPASRKVRWGFSLSR